MAKDKDDEYVVDADPDVPDRISGLDTIRDIVERGNVVPTRLKQKRAEQAILYKNKGNLSVADRRKIGELADEIKQIDNLRAERYAAKAMGAVSNLYKSTAIHGDVGRAILDTENQNRALSLSGLSYGEIRERKEAAQSRLEKIRGETSNVAQYSLFNTDQNDNNRNLKRGNAFNSMRVSLSDRQNEINELAVLEIAEKAKRQKGEDPESQMRSLYKSVNKAQSLLKTEEIVQQVNNKSGSLGSLSTNELKEKELEASKRLVDVFKELENAAEGSKDALREQAKSIEGEIKDISDAVGASGGGRRRGNLLSAGVPFLQQFGGAVSSVGLSAPMQDMQNRTGFAQYTNMLYGQRTAALGGDMTALLNLGGLDKIDAFGSSMGTAAATGKAFSTVADAATGAIQGAAVGGGVGALAGGAVAAASGVTDLLYGNTQNAATLNGMNANFGLNSAVNQIPGDFLQKFNDYSQANLRAARAGGGSTGRSITSFFEDSSSLNRMIDARVDPTQFMEMAGQGAADQGSAFNMNSVFSARNLERSGNGSMATNMQRFSALAAGGANSPNEALQKVLESAFSKSLDSSKSINMMVQNTAEMAKASFGSMAGLDVTGAASARIAALVDPNAANKEMAITAAAAAAQSFSDRDRGIGTSFSDQLTIGRVAAKTGVDRVAAMSLINTDDSALDTSINKAENFDSLSEEEKSSLLLEMKGMGLGAFIANNKPNLKNLKEARKQKAERSFRDIAVADPRVSKRLDAVERGEIGSYEEFMQGEEGTYIGQQASLIGKTGRQFYEHVTGNRDTSAGREAASAAMGGANMSSTQSTGDWANTMFANDAAKKTKGATTNFSQEPQSPTKLQEMIVAAQQSAADKLNDTTSKDFMNAAADAAKTFNVGSEKFSTAVGQFTTAVASMPGSTAGSKIDEAFRSFREWDKSLYVKTSDKAR